MFWLVLILVLALSVYLAWKYKKQIKNTIIESFSNSNVNKNGAKREPYLESMAIPTNVRQNIVEELFENLYVVKEEEIKPKKASESTDENENKYFAPDDETILADPRTGEAFTMLNLNTVTADQEKTTIQDMQPVTESLSVSHNERATNNVENHAPAEPSQSDFHHTHVVINEKQAVKEPVHSGEELLEMTRKRLSQFENK